MPVLRLNFTPAVVFARHRGGKIEVGYRVPSVSLLGLTLNHAPGGGGAGAPAMRGEGVRLC